MQTKISAMQLAMIDRKTAIKALKNDKLLFYKTQCTVVDKQSRILNFIPNETQLIIHNKAEEHLKKYGKVRLVILKGRQQGCTTLIRQRILQRVLYNKGVNARIMTHLHEASRDLFSSVRDCYANINDFLKPKASKNNESKLEFNSIKSVFSIATARANGTGRSATLQFFHGSEVAFWDNAEEHMRGIMQAISSGYGTEVFLESTANGMVGDAAEFYNKFYNGLDGEGDFESLFIPWFTNSEYARILPNDFKLQTFEDYCEIEYKRKYNLSDAKIYWMRKKIHTDFNKRYGMFCIEYPATPEEAFEGTGETSFIENKIVVQARKRKPAGTRQEIVMGVDVGGDQYNTSDRTVIVLRQDNDFKVLFSRKGITRNDLLKKMSEMILEYQPHNVYIDVTGIGYSLDSDLIAYCNISNIPIGLCQGVNFGQNANESDKFANAKAEMYHHLREKLILGSCEDDAEIQKDLTATGYQRDKMRRLQMQSKKNITQSPDIADAMALTCFQSPVIKFWAG